MDQLKESELDNDCKRQSADKICKILSLFDPGPDVSYLPIKQLLTKLLDIEKHCEYIRKDDILSVLVGHAGNKLVEGLCRLDYEGEANNAVMTYQSCAELTEEQRCLLHLSSLPVTDTRWKMFFLLTLKKQRHLLELIMVSTGPSDPQKILPSADNNNNIHVYIKCRNIGTFTFLNQSHSWILISKAHKT